ncbi:MAG TPA: SH3 domain-containing protein [Herpetosiphonaceae bacterium]
MGWSRRPNLPPNDPDAGDENDPLADNMRLRPRRASGGAQSLKPDANDSIHDQHTIVDNNFASRTRARRERQIASPFSTQRLGTWAANPDNSRTLLMIGAAVIGFLLLIAIFNLANRWYNSGATAEDTAEPTASVAPDFSGVTTGPLASAEPGVIVQPATNVPGTDPGQQPPSPAGGAFAVTGTGTEGLFLRQEHSTSAQILGTLPEGTRVESLGETFNDGTRDWLKVRTPLGEGWVAQQFLQPAQ